MKQNLSPDLKPYPSYKPSGVEWLGDMPAHWEVRRIKTLFREKDERSGDGHGELLSLTRSHGLIPQTEASNRIASIEDLSNYKVCRPGTLVMNRMQAWSGMFAVPSQKGLISPDYSVFELVSESEVKYFERLFKTSLLVGQFAQRSRGIGSGFNRLYTADFGSIPAIVPPLSEQTAIVRYLDWADELIRRYIRSRERLIELLEEYRQAVIHHAVTRGLDPDVRFMPSGIEWLGDVPAHWEVRRLKFSVENVIDQTQKRKKHEIYLAMEHVESWTGKYGDAGADVAFDSQVKRFRAEDVLFGKLRPYLAKVTRPDRAGVCVGEFLVLRPRNCTMSPSYLERLMRSKPIIDTINASTFGAKMPRADWQFIGSMAQPLPPLSEQIAISAYLDKTTADIDAAIDRARREIELLGEYRTRLVADVVTGQVDVREAEVGLSDEVDALKSQNAMGEPDKGNYL